MQVIFAAPFILLAGIVFCSLSIIPRARRWAIPIPTGVIVSGPCLLAVLMFEALAGHFLLHDSWPAWLVTTYLSIGVLAAVVGGIAAGILARFAAALLPRLLLRLAVFVAAWCSYLVVAWGAESLLSSLNSPKEMRTQVPGLLTFAVEVLLSFIGAFFIAQRSEEFRSRRIRLPQGMTFRKRNQSDIVGGSDGPSLTPPAPDAR
jgi:hypothetical protein